MYSLNAYKNNKAFRDIYDRILANCLRRMRDEREEDISKKLTLIAVCNKLLKQAFAIAKSGLVYDDFYRSILAKN